MAVVRSRNFSGQLTPRAEFVVETYVRCNFSHPEPIVDPDTGKKVGVPIFPTSRDVPRQFFECNLSNCDIPPNSLVEGCNTAIVGEEWDTETITVRGRPVSRVRQKRRVVYGRYVHAEDGSVTLEYFAP